MIYTTWTESCFFRACCCHILPQQVPCRLPACPQALKGGRLGSPVSSGKTSVPQQASCSSFLLGLTLGKSPEPSLVSKPAFHIPPAFCHSVCALRLTLDDKTSQPGCETLHGIVTFCCSHRANVSTHLVPRNGIYHSDTGRPLLHLSWGHISGCYVQNPITNRLLFYRSPCFHRSSKN